MHLLRTIKSSAEVCTLDCIELYLKTFFFFFKIQHTSNLGCLWVTLHQQAWAYDFHPTVNFSLSVGLQVEKHIPPCPGRCGARQDRQEGPLTKLLPFHHECIAVTFTFLQVQFRGTCSPCSEQ